MSILTNFNTGHIKICHYLEISDDAELVMLSIFVNQWIESLKKQSLSEIKIRTFLIQTDKCWINFGILLLPGAFQMFSGYSGISTNSLSCIPSGNDSKYIANAFVLLFSGKDYKENYFKIGMYLL
jgi:hypothetical protein